MKNDALLICGALLNPFTSCLKRELIVTDKPALVKMRNGDWCEIVYLAPNDSGHPYDVDQVPEGGFTDINHMRYWHADGRSLTSRDFDLIEHRFDD